MTEQIACFLLPSLAEPSARFPFGYLLETLLRVLPKPDNSRVSNRRVNPSPWLLFGVLVFVEKHLGTVCSILITSFDWVYLLVISFFYFKAAPSSRGLFSVVFAELTGARKRDLCPGSKRTVLSMRHGYLRCTIGSLRSYDGDGNENVTKQ